MESVDGAAVSGSADRGAERQLGRLVSRLVPGIQTKGGGTPGRVAAHEFLWSHRLIVVAEVARVERSEQGALAHHEPLSVGRGAVSRAPGRG